MQMLAVSLHGCHAHKMHRLGCDVCKVLVNSYMLQGTAEQTLPCWITLVFTFRKLGTKMSLQHCVVKEVSHQYKLARRIVQHFKYHLIYFVLWLKVNL